METKQTLVSGSTVTVASRYGLGTVCVVALALIWVALAELLVEIQEEKRPVGVLALTLITHGVYLVWLPAAVFLGRRWEGLSMSTVMYPAGFWLCVLFSTVFITWALSLTRTPLAANSAVYMSASVVVYIAEVALLGAAIKLRKLVAIAVSVAGVCIVALGTVESSSGSAGGSQLWLGYGFLLAATVSYALYEVLCKVLLPESGDQWSGSADAISVIAGLGIWTVVLLGPATLLAHVTGFEPFVMPSRHMWGLLILEGFLDSTFNILLVLGIQLTSPLFVSIGSTLVIPASMAADAIFHGIDPSFLGILGSLLITSSILILEYRALAAAARKALKQSSSPAGPLPLLSDTEREDYHAAQAELTQA